MTIKNYVLLDDKRIVEICGKTKFGYEYVDSKTESGIVITRTLLEDRIVKTSNNILDLLEVGDLVGCYYEKKSSDGKTWVETPIYYVNGISETHYHLPVFSIEKDDKHIKAIYKKQTNGDYKRYEVISWEH